MPAIYTKEDLPADVAEVTTKVLADNLSTETNIEIGLLIGANC